MVSLSVNMLNLCTSYRRNLKNFLRLQSCSLITVVLLQAKPVAS